jgi:FMN-dependent oxidoreductase (nitrilotriacetate monooxygenase family)
MPGMKLCGFLIAGPVIHSHAAWRNPYGDANFLSLEYYIKIAETLERGKFHFVFFADRLAVGDTYGQSLDASIRWGDQDATRLDPVPILGAMAARTSHLGLGATRSTSYDQPYNVAREFATLDHISGGRAAWNVVTSMNDSEARNFGVSQHLEHDKRYDRADEFLDVVTALWDSWDKDALVLDKESGRYADPAKVRYLNHSGPWYQVRGPLNIPRTPQGQPVIIQAGSSGRGREFAARWAEVVFNLQPSPAKMKAFYSDLKSRLPVYGRKASDLQILPAIMPFVGATMSEAKEKQRIHNERVTALVGLSTLSGHANYDFSRHELSEILASVDATGTQGNLQNVVRLAQEKQLDLAAIGRLYAQGVMVPQITGTADEVADYMAGIYKDAGADGFVISPAFLPQSFEDFVDGVIPRLQSLNLFQKEYSSGQLRDNLMAS